MVERLNRVWRLAVGAFVLGCIVVCSRFGENASLTKETSLQLVGSSSMEKLTDALAESFMEQYPEVTVTVQFTGSSAGIEAVSQGSADIGTASRDLSETEKARGVTGYVVALDGIAICVDPSNSVTEMTKQQLADIYTGKLRNWSALGGDDMPIVLIGREASSGTREAFEDLMEIRGQCTYANELDSTGAVMARIASTPGAIGYVSFDVAGVHSNVSVLALDGIEPTAANVKNGEYPLCRPFLMVTRGEVSEQSNLVQLWLHFVYSEEGQNMVEKAGFVKIAGAKQK